LPADYAEDGLVTAQGYHADDLLRRPDGLIDGDYEAQLTDAGRRAREADLLVAVDGPRPEASCALVGLPAGFGVPALKRITVRGKSLKLVAEARSNS
jgi:hypothetical protein